MDYEARTGCYRYDVDKFVEHPSLAGAWDGSEFHVHPNARDADSDVWFVVPPDAGDPEDAPRTWEALRTKKVAADLHEICASPVFLEGVAFGDQFTTMTMADGIILPTTLVRASGMASGQVWIGENHNERWLPLAVALAAVGCVVDVYSEKLMGMSWPAAASDSVADVVNSEAGAGQISWQWRPSAWRPSA